ncbi:unnamed protein product [Arabidopsis thaliana]|uniref:RING-type domain-containing protein n=2 Tax=Arabidopsis TaxID=3701 RepID=A0A654GCI6_ARATH|nr:Zinc finger RING-type [Arabidopsis suecica]VYS70694.1 unnamed protein product [Arabidopsis thaliana]
MDSKAKDDEKTLNMDSKAKYGKEALDMLLKLQQRVDEIHSELQSSGASATTSSDIQNIYNEIQQLLQMITTNKPQDPSKVSPHIRDDLDMLFVLEEVGHSCDLCQRDLAKDPERPNASLTGLQEACVLSCGHVYHFKCLKGTTLDIANHSKDPSCIFCISC